jgi:hypothetical protein
MKIDRLLLIVFIIATLILAWLVYFAYSQAGMCLRNPYIYGARQQDNVECSCLQFENQMCPSRFSFNTSGMTTEITECGTFIANPNYLKNGNLTILINNTH